MTDGRAPRAAAVAALLLLTATACGGGGDGGEEAAARYTPADSRITVRAGERFEVAVQVNGSTREDWQLLAPGRSGPVVRSDGSRGEGDTAGKKEVGGGRTVVHTFEAVKPGSARIEFLHCTFAAPCPGSEPVAPTRTAGPTPAPSAGPSAGPERRTITVTVD
ncbi:MULTISPECIES: protease inhibitor I42 family protein [unclassified Streptomyces]|uniref:Protease inhibitor I42 family protein n=2 Tax=Streptomyces TaxID=1883 RepID=A0ABV5VD69_9ACTN